MSPSYPKRVTLVEVGPRDGLQNETAWVPTEAKIAFIRDLSQCGLSEIEATSFVNPKRIPQLADAAEVCAALPAMAGNGIRYSALVPNRRGLEAAMAAGIRRIAVFTAASETFTQKNINMSVDESLETFRPVVKEALEQGLSVRAYVSTAFVCPYEGDIRPEPVAELILRLLEMGADQVSLGDTIGAAAPSNVFATVGRVLNRVSTPDRLALHFHDTYGTALANVVAGLELGIATYDASAGGLGGCPYAPGASGNIATEDLVYLLTRMGIETGVDLALLTQAAQRMAMALGRRLPSRQLAIRNAHSDP